MTLDEAIKYFEDCCKDEYCIEGEDCVQCNAEMFALKVLKEKREEDKRKEDFKAHHNCYEYYGKFICKNYDIISNIMNSICCNTCDGLEKYGCAGCQKEIALIDILLENYNSFK